MRPFRPDCLSSRDGQEAIVISMSSMSVAYASYTTSTYSPSSVQSKASLGASSGTHPVKTTGNPTGKVTGPSTPDYFASEVIKTLKDFGVDVSKVSAAGGDLATAQPGSAEAALSNFIQSVKDAMSANRAANTGTGTSAQVFMVYMQKHSGSSGDMLAGQTASLEKLMSANFTSMTSMLGQTSSGEDPMAQVKKSVQEAFQSLLVALGAAQPSKSEDGKQSAKGEGSTGSGNQQSAPSLQAFLQRLTGNLANDQGNLPQASSSVSIKA
ncbi:hypothetical protein KSF73_14300 [Burkholderiaceae bacterium DAT-1]|nr:hypothetical protein [Burkholderiaceae bacterium DAT-1]